VSAAAVLSTGAVRQSVSAEASRDHLSDDRAHYGRAQASYRIGTQVAGGVLTADLDIVALRQDPDRPAPIDEATGATPCNWASLARGSSIDCPHGASRPR
jgi:hypothetical protein